MRISIVAVLTEKKQQNKQTKNKNKNKQNKAKQNEFDANNNFTTPTLASSIPGIVPFLGWEYIKEHDQFMS